MRILYIIFGCGNSVEIGGGSLIRTTEVAKRVNKDNKVFFLTSTGGKKTLLQSKFNKQNIFEAKSYLFRCKTEKNYLDRFWAYLVSTVRVFTMVKILPKVDIIYTDSDGFWDVVPAFLYKKKNPAVKWVSLSYHKIALRKDNVQSFFVSLINIIIQRFSYFFICRYPDAIFVLDTDMGDKIKNFFREKKYKKQIYSVKAGIDIEQIKTVPEQEKKYDACFLGGLRPSKGLYDFVPIWKKVCQKKENAKLIIIGGMFPKYREYLNEEIARRNLEGNIVIKGFIRDKIEVIKLIKQSRIFIFPSHEEGWGISIMECLVAGLPGVLWDLPVYKKIFNRGVIKVKPFDINLFVERILHLLNNQKAYNDFREETIGGARQYDWDNVGKEELATFEDILSLRQELRKNI